MSSKGRVRLDRTLVARGLASDLDEARGLVDAGVVLVGGAVATSAGRLVAPDEPLVVRSAKRFVGRGAEKLDGALSAFGLEVAGSLCVDLGSSTGGFTDCLVSRGARRVLAVDVGRHQLHERLRADPRVISLEGTNLTAVTRAAVREALGGAPQLVTVDLSFTSIVGHVPAIVSLAEDGDVVALVKPQFEVSHEVASRGAGVVRDPSDWSDAVVRCASALARAGAGIMDVMASPLRGASGNVEFFVHARCGALGVDPAALATRIAAVVDAVLT